MPKIHKVAQGELEWLTLRMGRVTASEMDNLITPTFEQRKGEMPHSYLCSKLAEAWRGKPLPGFSSHATEQGQILEDEARRWYCFEFDQEQVHNVGFVEHDNGRCGASPDALIGEDGGLELKCPEPQTHVKYLLGGELPKIYTAQVHMSLYVTQRPWWRFVSYRRGFPPFVLKVERDEAICEKIEAALESFYKTYDAAMKKLRDEFEEKP